MSETTGYEEVKCQFNFPDCENKKPRDQRLGAGYSRRQRYAQQGPWLDACQNCASVPYEQPAQFQEAKS